jgi:hypothetical protein
MKKMIVIASVALCAAIANAASFSWSIESGRIYNGTGATGSENYASGLTAYLFDSAAYSMDKAVSDFYGTGLNTASKLASTTVTDGARIDYTEFTYGTATSGSLSAYFVVVDDDKIYVSTVGTGLYSPVGTAALEFDSQTTPSKATFEANAAYTGAGWYTAVPEPTSGLLMLVGLAGLALRRRRA